LSPPVGTDRGGRPTGLSRWVLAAQGVYYLLTGIWPLVSIRTFELVTGPKTDDWLVQTVGVLAGVIGATLLVGGLRVRPRLETLVLSLGAALGFAGVDVTFVLAGRIPPIYLADAAAELVFIVLVGGLVARRGE
jgi:hypothetical protein